METSQPNPFDGITPTEIEDLYDIELNEDGFLFNPGHTKELLKNNFFSRENVQFYTVPKRNKRGAMHISSVVNLKDCEPKSIPSLVRMIYEEIVNTVSPLQTMIATGIDTAEDKERCINIANHTIHQARSADGFLRNPRYSEELNLVGEDYDLLEAQLDQILGEKNEDHQRDSNTEVNADQLIATLS